jgi:P-type conjugative transfer protein VirB9
MIKRVFKTLAALTLLLASATVFALAIPRSLHGGDSHIKYIDYDANNVVLIQSYTGTATTIIFSDDETIQNVICGYAEAWQFTRAGNHLFLKAVAPNANTNLIVLTNKRLYNFELRLRGIKSPEARPSYSSDLAFTVIFRYPDADKQQIAAKRQEEIFDQQKNVLPPPRNWNYQYALGAKSKGIVPSRVFDDGRFTYMTFPANTEIPACFVVNSDGKEAIVNTHIAPIDKDTLVVHRIAKEFMLRLGNEVVAIRNGSYSAKGIGTPTGTTVPGLVRGLRAEVSK